MIPKKLYCIILIFLLASPPAFSVPSCERGFLSFMRNESGAFRWKFWEKPLPPSTSILRELSQRDVEVRSSISAYNAHMIDYHEVSIEWYQNVYSSVQGLQDLRGIGSSYYWGGYVQKRPGRYEKPSEVMEGKFIIGFGMLVKGQTHSDRAGHFYHRIHWDSGARGKALDSETVKQIFTEIYGGKPEEVITDFQMQFINRETHEEVRDGFIYPFLRKGKREEEVKQTVLRVLQERGIDL